MSLQKELQQMIVDDVESWADAEFVARNMVLRIESAFKILDDLKTKLEKEEEGSREYAKLKMAILCIEHIKKELDL